MKLEYEPAAACAALAAADPVMARLIAARPFTLEQRMAGDSFPGLLRAIVYQQLSGKAAATIHGRVLALCGDGAGPADYLALSAAQLRGAGLSANKCAAVRDLAAKSLDGTVPGIRRLRRLTDAEIIERLVQVRGVGRWTVEMLLIFRLGRPDVLPVDDLGVRKGYAAAYHAPLPKPKQLTAAGAAWAPYRSVASWYLWRASEGLAASAPPGDKPATPR